MQLCDRYKIYENHGLNLIVTFNVGAGARLSSRRMKHIDHGGTFDQWKLLESTRSPTCSQLAVSSRTDRRQLADILFKLPIHHCPMFPSPYVRLPPLRRSGTRYLLCHSRAESSDIGLIQTTVRMWNMCRPDNALGLRASKYRWMEKKTPVHTANRIWLLNGSQPCDWSASVRRICAFNSATGPNWNQFFF